MLYHVKSPFLMMKSDEIPFLQHTSASYPCFTGEKNGVAAPLGPAGPRWALGPAFASLGALALRLPSAGSAVIAPVPGATPAAAAALPFAVPAPATSAPEAVWLEPKHGTSMEKYGKNGWK